VFAEFVELIESVVGFPAPLITDRLPFIVSPDFLTKLFDDQTETFDAKMLALYAGKDAFYSVSIVGDEMLLLKNEPAT
jgi:hypothetical protein